MTALVSLIAITAASSSIFDGPLRALEADVGRLTDLEASDQDFADCLEFLRGHAHAEKSTLAVASSDVCRSICLEQYVVDQPIGDAIAERNSLQAAINDLPENLLKLVTLRRLLDTIFYYLIRQVPPTEQWAEYRSLAKQLLDVRYVKPAEYQKMLEGHAGAGIKQYMSARNLMKPLDESTGEQLHNKYAAFYNEKLADYDELVARLEQQKAIVTAFASTPAMKHHCTIAYAVEGAAVTHNVYLSGAADPVLDEVYVTDLDEAGLNLVGFNPDHVFRGDYPDPLTKGRCSEDKAMRDLQRDHANAQWYLWSGALPCRYSREAFQHYATQHHGVGSITLVADTRFVYDWTRKMQTVKGLI